MYYLYPRNHCDVDVICSNNETFHMLSRDWCAIPGENLLFVVSCLCQLKSYMHLTYVGHAEPPLTMRGLVGHLVSLGVKSPRPFQDRGDVSINFRRFCAICHRNHAHHDQLRRVSCSDGSAVLVQLDVGFHHMTHPRCDMSQIFQFCVQYYSRYKAT